MIVIHGSIYRIKNLDTGKSYIGKTIRNPAQRWEEHIERCHPIVQNGLVGVSFEVVEIVVESGSKLRDNAILRERERVWIAKEGKKSMNRNAC